MAILTGARTQQRHWYTVVDLDVLSDQAQEAVRKSFAYMRSKGVDPDEHGSRTNITRIDADHLIVAVQTDAYEFSGIISDTVVEMYFKHIDELIDEESEEHD
jgi:hypothetical protein